ncbi:glycoside hydrolase family 18 protein [Pluteus cervinus]|uniref:Glycoside hydrolase family 18 protein n=1 Tax=Pluteus cervinus TaxID=181527 RepID=A0ACD3B644_9AGAR|nr:glycoside hydrolase family 18 protein [Pluteus cervinus]
MLASKFFGLVSAILSCGALVSAAPSNTTHSADPEIITAAAPSPPYFVVYGDAWDGTTGPPTVDQIKGFNVYNMAFLLLAGAWDKAFEWSSLTDSQRSTIKSQYAAAGIKLVVSVFGSTDIPTTTGSDPVQLANSLAAWVKQYSLDGIDVDYEDFAAFNGGTAEAWLITFTKQLRNQLPSGQYIITHARQYLLLSASSHIPNDTMRIAVAPWFSPNVWPGGGYLRVNREVGNLIDWYNVQFYNQGASEYTDCNNLLTSSSSAWPQSSVFQIAASGVPMSKIVIGKPAGTGDATNGMISTTTLADCLRQGKANGWSVG